MYLAHQELESISIISIIITIINYYHNICYYSYYHYYCYYCYHHHYIEIVSAMAGGAPGDRVHHRAGPGGVATESGCWSGPAPHSGSAAHPGKHTSLPPEAIWSLRYRSITSFSKSPFHSVHLKVTKSGD